MQQYRLDEVSGFKKVSQKWGEFSNMSAFPINVAGIHVLTTEALYQALRYPHLPEVQQTIIDQKSPMAAKMKSKPYRKNQTHQLFLDNQLDIMEWCVRLKVAQHYYKLIRSIKTAKNVVEISHKDQFWGAVALKTDPNIVVGENHLGKIWDKIIQDYKNNKDIKIVESLNISNLTLLNKSINFKYQQK
jgi:ribA/ribD-fused uncharacterized protein